MMQLARACSRSYTAPHSEHTVWSVLIGAAMAVVPFLYRITGPVMGWYR